MKFRTKAFIGLLGLVLFWFLVFYPYILPYMEAKNVYPLLAVVIFEGLFFVSLYIVSLIILGAYKQHSLKIAIVIFTLSHIYDSFEPPSILNVQGGWDFSTGYLISWDYGVSYFLKDVFHIVGSNLYYITNIGVVLLLIIISVMIITPQTLGKIARKILW